MSYSFFYTKVIFRNFNSYQKKLNRTLKGTQVMCYSITAIFSLYTTSYNQLFCAVICRQKKYKYIFIYLYTTLTTIMQPKLF